MGLMTSILDGIDTFLAWTSTSLKQTIESYCEIQTADSPTVLVAHDGSLLSILSVRGVTSLIGSEEFNRILEGLGSNLQTIMSRPGYTIQVHFSYNKDIVGEEIADIFQPARETSNRLQLNLNDLFKERQTYLAKYCAHEAVHLVLWTRPNSLTREQFSRANKEKRKLIKEKEVPAFRHTQNIAAAIPDLRDAHDAFVRAVNNEMNALGILTEILNAHDADFA